MTSEIVINVNSREARVALLEDGVVTEIFIERESDRSIVSNIYKGRVVRILPGMEAAFVDIGLEKAGFLYVTDVREEFEDFDLLVGEEGEWLEEREVEERPCSFKIEDLLKVGQELLVQVAKEPLGTKGARLTSRVTLPGRNLVFMPCVDHVGISRRIDNERERRRLRDIISSIRPPGTGFIVRTAGEGKEEAELRNDMEFLIRLWNSIQRKGEAAGCPSLIHDDLDLALRAVRDLVSTNGSQVLVDSTEEYQRILEFVDNFMPALKPRVEVYQGEENIFDAYGIELELSRSLGRKVWLKSGGYIIIEQTEGLTAIDVNTGRFVGKRRLEDTLIKTNLEAVKEIAYQLRLRNIGGIIIIDFIDMERSASREKVYAALLGALKKDRAKSNILRISELGLVEMTRQRIRENLTQILCEPCAYCEGKGYLRSKQTVCYELFREIRREAASISSDKIMVRVHPDVAGLFYDEERHGIEDLERQLGKTIIIKAKPQFHQEQFEISGG